jgi:hypothetical protein
MKKSDQQKYALIGSIIFIAMVIVAQNRIGAFLGLPGNVDLVSKDSSGQPLSGVICYINPSGDSRCSDPTQLDANGNMVCQMKAVSGSNGYCSFKGIPSGEFRGWSTTCGTGSVRKQGSVEVKAPAMGQVQTTSVYVTLAGCTSVGGGTVTTTTIPACTVQTLGGAGASLIGGKAICYLGDVWDTDSCGSRTRLVQSCGTYGCSSGVCIGTPTTVTTLPKTTTTLKPGVTTTTIKGATTTTLAQGCVDICDNVGECIASGTAGEDGVRCVSKNGCNSFVKDSTCSSGADTSQLAFYGVITAIVGVVAYMVFSITKKKK